MKISVPSGFIGKKARHMWAGIVAALPQALLLGTFGSATATDEPLFAAPFLSLDTGSSPWSVAIGDLNGDGKPDLAVACWSADGLSVFPGNGDGTFQGRVNYPVQYGAACLAIGDVNLDGRPDVVVGEGINEIAVLLGIGDGTLAPPRYFNANPLLLAPPPLEGRSPIDAESQGHPRVLKPANLGGVAMGDLDGDGLPDVAVGLDDIFSYDGSVQVMLGSGDGTFRLGPRVYGTCHPQSVTIRDLNGDGWLDLAVGACGATVILNQGNGILGPAQSYPPGNCITSSVAIGDVDGDGHSDLAVASACNDTVSVLPGNGDGSFRAKRNFQTGNTSVSVALGDLDGDGLPDLVTADYGSAMVTVLMGSGNGTFGVPSNYGTGSGRHSAGIGDLNGDGRPDLAVVNSDSNTVTVMLNRVRAVSVPPGSAILPKAFQMLAPRPNPSRAATQIRFVLAAACVVDANLFDAAGRRVRSIGSGQELPPGQHVLLWDGLDSGGHLVPDGVYLVQIRAGRDIGLGRLVRLK